MLKITTTPALIGIDHQPPRLQTKTHLPELPLKTTPPQIEIKRKPAQVTIDQSHVQAELGFRDHRFFGQYYAQEGQRAVLQGIARTAQEGDRMAALEQGGNAISQIAQANFTETAELNITPWPTQPPKIAVDPGQLSISTKPGGVKGHYSRAHVTGDFTWAVVDVYLRQKPTIEVEALVDKKV